MLKAMDKFKNVTTKSGGGMVAYEKWSCTGGLIWKAFLVFSSVVLWYQNVFDGVAQRPYPIYSMMSFPCFLFTSSK